MKNKCSFVYYHPLRNKEPYFYLFTIEWSNDKEESLGAFKERMKKARVTDVWPPAFVRNPLLPKGKSIEMLSPG